MLSASDALIVPTDCISTYMFCTFHLLPVIVMHCPDLQLSNALSHVLFIVLVPDTSISW